MSRMDSYLTALLALSGDEQLVGARRALLKSLDDDDDLTYFAKKIMEREFARGDLEGITSIILDVIARNQALADTRATGGDQTAEVKAEGDAQRNIPTPSMRHDSEDTASATPDSRSASQPATSIAQPQLGPAAPIVAVSLRCQTEQVIANMIVPPIQCVRWHPASGDYIDFQFGSHEGPEDLCLANRFDKDYLSTKLHIEEWSKLLRLQEKGLASGCCVNDTVIGRTKHASTRTSLGGACDRCIKTKRLCARLVRMEDGVVKLAFFPLPLSLWVKDGNLLSQWVRP